MVEIMIDKSRLQQRMNLISAGHCDKPWFDPNSPHDQKITTYGSNQCPIETDTFEGLRIAQIQGFSPCNDFQLFQHWGDWQKMDDGSRVRPYYALTAERALRAAEIIKGGPARRLILLVTMFMKGALRAFADAMGPGQLEMMGFFWYFSGDDITDEAENAPDIMYAAKTLDLRRISILTGAFDKTVEKALAEGIMDCPSLEVLEVYRKDGPDYTWPRYQTPLIDAALGK